MLLHPTPNKAASRGNDAIECVENELEYLVGFGRSVCIIVGQNNDQFLNITQRNREKRRAVGVESFKIINFHNVELFIHHSVYICGRFKIKIVR